MRYQAHRIGGICTGLIAGELMCSNLPPKEKLITMAVMTGACAFGSLLPDIDEPSSYVGKRVKPISTVIKSTSGHRWLWHSPFLDLLLPVFLLVIYVFGFSIGYGDIIKKVTLGFFGLLSLRSLYSMIRYRRVPVTSLLWTAFSVFCIYNEELHETFYFLTIFGIFLGYTNHLFLDSLTIRGIPLFYPFSDKKYSLMRLKSGRDDIYVIIVMIVVVTLFFVARRYI